MDVKTWGRHGNAMRFRMTVEAFHFPMVRLYGLFNVRPRVRRGWCSSRGRSGCSGHEVGGEVCIPLLPVIRMMLAAVPGSRYYSKPFEMGGELPACAEW